MCLYVFFVEILNKAQYASLSKVYNFKLSTLNFKL